MWFKKIKVPVSNETKKQIAVQLWTVSWISRYGNFSGQTQREFEAFTSKEEANEFADALRNAFKLIKHKSQCDVTVKPN